MALRIPFETPDGVEHPESYWRVAEANVDFFGGHARITLVGWHNQAAREGGKRPLEGAEKTYDILTREEYLAWFSPAALDAAGRNHAAQAYEFAKAKQDMQFQVGEESIGHRSFFTGAVDV